MKKELIILALLIILAACTTEPVKKARPMSSPLPNKALDLSTGLDMNSPELKPFVDELKNQDAVWFNKISTKEVKITIKKGNEFTPEKSKEVCESTCNTCSKKLGKTLASIDFKQYESVDDSCVCSFEEELNGGNAYSCLNEANKRIFSEIFDDLVLRDPSVFPKQNQMRFMFANYDTAKLSKDFCDTVCGYCSTKFNQELEFVSPSIDEEGDLKCTCQTMDPYGVSLYRVNMCLTDLANIIPSK